MNRLLSSILLLLIFTSCHSISGSGKIVSQNMQLSGFNGIQTSGSIDIEIKPGSNESVVIEADDNVQPYIAATVQNGLLDIHYKPNMSFMNTHAKVLVTATTLNKLIVSGSGDIISYGTLTEANKVEIIVEGSGSIKAGVDAPSVITNIDGSGSIDLNGRTRNFEGTISGSGDLKCHNLLSENTTLTVEGSGKAHVYASVSLTATISGSGDIFYSGHPARPQLIKHGSGSFKEEN